MVSTVVTTSTVTSVTTDGTVVVAGLVAVITLIAFLIVKELTSVSKAPKLGFMSRFLDVGIVSLSIAFVVSVAGTMAQVLG